MVDGSDPDADPAIRVGLCRPTRDRELDRIDALAARGESPTRIGMVHRVIGADSTQKDLATTIAGFLGWRFLDDVVRRGGAEVGDRRIALERDIQRHGRWAVEGHHREVGIACLAAGLPTAAVPLQTDIPAGAAVEAVVAVAADEEVTPDATRESIIVLAAIDAVMAGVAQQDVTAAIATEAVVAVAASYTVGTVIATDGVVALAASDRVIAVAPADTVVSATAVDVIVTPAAEDDIGTRGAMDDVIAVGPDDGGLRMETRLRGQCRCRQAHPEHEDERDDDYDDAHAAPPRTQCGRGCRGASRVGGPACSRPGPMPCRPATPTACPASSADGEVGHRSQQRPRWRLPQHRR